MLSTQGRERGQDSADDGARSQVGKRGETVVQDITKQPKLVTMGVIAGQEEA